MIVPPAGVRVLIARRPVDFRCGADGLAATAMPPIAASPIRSAPAGQPRSRSAE